MEQQPTFNELLINEVQLHPQLYDQQHRACTDNGERNAIWMTIAARIDDNITGMPSGFSISTNLRCILQYRMYRGVREETLASDAGPIQVLFYSLNKQICTILYKFCTVSFVNFVI
jgi:hypothetical protein